jgi:hypothetical protein
MNRAPRSTRAMLPGVETHQSQVISALIESGHHEIARRLARCQHERRHRQPGWPWRCRSPGCWACRRTLMRRWWRGFRLWFGDTDVSLMQIPISGDLISITRRLRKGLRDVRDRTGRHNRRWAGVAMAGLADGDHALIQVKHPGFNRAEVWARFERRWPGIVIGDPGSLEPTSPCPLRTLSSWPASVPSFSRFGSSPWRR